MNRKILIPASCVLLVIAICNPDRLSAQQDIEHIYAQTNNTIVVRFESTLDTATATDTNRYIVPGINLRRALIEGPEGRTVVLISDSSLVDTAYTLDVAGVKYHGQEPDSLVLTGVHIPMALYEWWNVQKDTMERVHHSAYWSREHNRLLGFSIYLPPGYEEADSLPCEYFLGGLGNDENVMYPKMVKYVIPAIDSKEVPPFIIVWPNPMRGSWYLDEERYHVETMITRELIPHVDTTFKTMKSVKGRWISGFSMGGFGSLNLGMRHTGLFSSVVSYAIARQPTIEDPADVRDNLQIRLICGENDFYYPMEYTLTYKSLQSNDIPVDYESVPLIPHSIGGLYNKVGIKGLKFHWKMLGGFNEKPLVDAGDSLFVGHVNNSVDRLPGKVIDDHREGNELITYWTLHSGPGTVEFSDSILPGAEARFSDAGDYLIVLTAKDGEFSITDTLEVHVSADPVNFSPEVDAGSDRYLFYPENTLVLPGQAADDGLPDGGEFSSWWSLVEGPVDVVFTDTLDPGTEVTFNSAGEYVLRLTASDSQLEAKRDLHITVTDEEEIVPAVRYRMNEYYGDTVFNVTGGGMNGILYRDPERIVGGGKEGNCVKLNGVDQYITIQGALDTGYFSEPITERTISLWFMTDNNRIGTHMLYEEGSRTNGISISKSGGFLTAAVAATGHDVVLLDGIFNYTTGWQHVALGFSSGGIVLYLNGELLEETNASFTSIDGYEEIPALGATLNTAAFSVGAGDGMKSHFLDGYLDDFQLFDLALDEAEIQKLAGLPVGLEDNVRINRPVVTVFPNPADNYFIVRSGGEWNEMGLVMMYDLTGRKVFSRQYDTKGDLKVDLPESLQGIYILKVIIRSSIFTTRVIIK